MISPRGVSLLEFSTDKKGKKERKKKKGRKKRRKEGRMKR
jgi:hypothetical protein